MPSDAVLADVLLTEFSKPGLQVLIIPRVSLAESGEFAFDNGTEAVSEPICLGRWSSLARVTAALPGLTGILLRVVQVKHWRLGVMILRVPRAPGHSQAVDTGCEAPEPTEANLRGALGCTWACCPCVPAACVCQAGPSASHRP